MHSHKRSYEDDEQFELEGDFYLPAGLIGEPEASQEDGGHTHALSGSAANSRSWKRTTAAYGMDAYHRFPAEAAPAAVGSPPAHGWGQLNWSVSIPTPPQPSDSDEPVGVAALRDSGGSVPTRPIAIATRQKSQEAEEQVRHASYEKTKSRSPFGAGAHLPFASSSYEAPPSGFYRPPFARSGHSSESGMDRAAGHTREAVQPQRAAQAYTNPSSTGDAINYGMGGVAGTSLPPYQQGQPATGVAAKQSSDTTPQTLAMVMEMLRAVPADPSASKKRSSGEAEAESGPPRTQLDTGSVNRLSKSGGFSDAKSSAREAHKARQRQEDARAREVATEHKATRVEKKQKRRSGKGAKGNSELPPPPGPPPTDRKRKRTSKDFIAQASVMAGRPASFPLAAIARHVGGDASVVVPKSRVKALSQTLSDEQREEIYAARDLAASERKEVFHNEVISGRSKSEGEQRKLVKQSNFAKKEDENLKQPLQGGLDEGKQVKERSSSRKEEKKDTGKRETKAGNKRKSVAKSVKAPMHDSAPSSLVSLASGVLEKHPEEEKTLSVMDELREEGGDTEVAVSVATIEPEEKGAPLPSSHEEVTSQLAGEAERATQRAENASLAVEEPTVAMKEENEGDERTERQTVKRGAREPSELQLGAVEGENTPIPAEMANADDVRSVGKTDGEATALAAMEEGISDEEELQNTAVEKKRRGKGKKSKVRRKVTRIIYEEVSDDEEDQDEQDSAMGRLGKSLAEVGRALTQLLWTLHQSAFEGATHHYHVAVTILYIYCFPAIAHLFFWTDTGPSGTSVSWYMFLIGFFLNKGKKLPPYPAVNLWLLLPLLFVFEGVCNPRYIARWNGGERLVFSFVLLSMKSNGFANWRTFFFLGALIVASVSVGTSLVGQWVILILLLSCVNSSSCFSSSGQLFHSRRKERELAERDSTPADPTETDVSGLTATVVSRCQPPKAKPTVASAGASSGHSSSRRKGRKRR